MPLSPADTSTSFVAVTITHAHLASRVPERLDGGFRGDVRHAIFVAQKAS